MLNNLKFLIIGLVSGYLSFYLLESTELIEVIGLGGVAIFILPGFIFGLAMLFLSTGNSIVSKFVWILGSTAASSMAVLFVFYFGEYIAFGKSGDEFIMILAGVIGALIMLIVFSLALRKLGLLQIITLSLLGGILSLSYFIPRLTDLLLKEQFFLFLTWQGGMAMALAWATSRNKVSPFFPQSY